jgi:hypothetical protein
MMICLALSDYNRFSDKTGIILEDKIKIMIIEMILLGSLTFTEE